MVYHFKSKALSFLGTSKSAIERMRSLKEPLYQHIIMDLKQAIIAGTYPPGSKLPTELNLSETYGVSRITSKRALVELENEGIVIRVRGKGSFVREKAVVSQSKTIKKRCAIYSTVP